MKPHHLLALATGLAALGLAVLPAAAAVTVMGKGLAENCYQAAEFGGDTGAGIEVCGRALQDQPLSVADRASTYVNRGILRARADDPDGALRDYDTGLRLQPDLAEGYVDRGAAYLLVKRYKDAIADIDKGLALNVKRPHIAYYDRAIANEALGNIRAAYEDYKKAVELAPDFALAIQQLQRFKVVRKRSTNDM